MSTSNSAVWVLFRYLPKHFLGFAVSSQRMVHSWSILPNFEKNYKHFFISQNRTFYTDLVDVEWGYILNNSLLMSFFWISDLASFSYLAVITSTDAALRLMKVSQGQILSKGTRRITPMMCYIMSRFVGLRIVEMFLCLHSSVVGSIYFIFNLSIFKMLGTSRAKRTHLKIKSFVFPFCLICLNNWVSTSNPCYFLGANGAWGWILG